jgi:hypothetical protein
MKKLLLILIAFFSILRISSQTDDWYLFTKASQITKIQPDDVNTDELHLATDIGYIKYNTTTNTVTDFLNLTSQDPAIAQVKDIALDPTSDNIAMTLKSGIAIYDGNLLSTYSYDDTDLTIGENTSQFRYLKVSYAQNGSLYIYKEDALGYQIFENGVFQTETVTTFRPQDIIENNAGTKVFFAGDSNGLWELEKGTNTWANYTISNSSIVSNFTTSLHVSSTDLLYVGGYQGLSTLSPSGVWKTYQENDPVNNFPYNIIDVALNETTGNVLLKTSQQSSYYNGLTIANLNTNIWTNYREDGVNCLNENVFSATAFGADGNVYAAPTTFPKNGTLTQLNPSTEVCTDMNVNYLNSPEKADSSIISDIDIINPADTIFIGMTRADRLIILAQRKTDAFNGSFGSISEVKPSPGNSSFSVVSANGKFVVENNEGWVIVDKDKNTTTHNHGIPNNLAIRTEKASFTSSNGDVTLINMGFDAAFNYHVFKTPCNTTTGVFGSTEEIFTNDRDFTKEVKFGSYEDATTGLISCLGVKTNASGEISREMLNWTKQTNGSISSSFDEPHTNYPTLNPEVIKSIQSDLISIFVKDLTTVDARTDSDYDSRQFDKNNDGQPDGVKYSNTIEIQEDGASDIGDLLMFWLGGGLGSKTTSLTLHRLFNKAPDAFNKSSNKKSSNIIEITDTPVTSITNNLPSDIVIRKSVFKQYNSSEAIAVLLTNYGLLIKKGIDISSLTLSAGNINSNLKDISIAPNPSNNYISFSDKTITSIAVFDINGRQVLSNNGNSISVKTLSNGLYIVKGITDNGFSVSKKLIKN